MTDAELRDVRVALPDPDYSTSGLRLRDARNVPVLIEVVSTDGARRTDHQRGPGVPCAGWLGIGEHCSGEPRRDRTGWSLRAVVRSPTDQAQWAVEVRAIIPSGSTTLLQAARNLAVDGSLVASAAARLASYGWTAGRARGVDAGDASARGSASDRKQGRRAAEGGAPDLVVAPLAHPAGAGPKFAQRGRACDGRPHRPQGVLELGELMLVGRVRSVSRSAK